MSQLTLSAVLEIVDEATRPLKSIQQQSNLSNESVEELTRSIKQLNNTLQSGQQDRYNSALREQRRELNLVKSAASALSTTYKTLDNTLNAVHKKTKSLSLALKQQRAEMRAEMKNMAIGGAMAAYMGYNFLKPAIEFEQQMSRVQAVLDLDKTSDDMAKLMADARKQGAASSFSPTEAAQAQHALASGGFGTQQILDSLAGTLQLAEAGQVELQRAAQIAVGTLNGFGLSAKEITRVNDILLRSTDLTATSVDGFGETMKYVAPIAKAYGVTIEETSALIGLLGNNNILDSQAGTSLRSIMTRFATLPKPAYESFEKLGISTADANGNLRAMTDIITEVAAKTSNMGSKEKLEIFSSIAGQEAVSAFSVLIDQTSVIDSNTGKSVNNLRKLTDQLYQAEGAAARAAAILKNNLGGDIEQLGGSVQDLAISITQIFGQDLRNFVKGLGETVNQIKSWIEANPELVRQIASIAKKLLILKLITMGISYTFSLLVSGILFIILSITKLGIALFLINKVANLFGIRLPSQLRTYWQALKILTRHIFILARTAFPILMIAVRMFFASFLTNPLFMMAAAFAILIRLVYNFKDQIGAFLDGFGQGFSDGLAVVKQIFADFWQTLTSTFTFLQPIVDSLLAGFTAIKNFIYQMLQPMQSTTAELNRIASAGYNVGVWIAIAASAFMILRSVMMTVAAVQAILTFLTVLRAALVANAIAAWAFLAPFLPIIAAVVALAAAAYLIIANWEPIKAWWKGLMNDISYGVDLGIAAFNRFIAAIVQIGATFIDFLLTPLRAVIDAVNTLIGALNRIPSIKIPSIPQIPSFAAQTSAPVAAAQTPKVQAKPTIPFRTAAAQAPKGNVNHFAGARITIAGVQDPKLVASIVDQKLQQHQRNLQAQQNRSYGDFA